MGLPAFIEVVDDEAEEDGKVLPAAAAGVEGRWVWRLIEGDDGWLDLLRLKEKSSLGMKEEGVRGELAAEFKVDRGEESGVGR